MTDPYEMKKYIIHADADSGVGKLCEYVSSLEKENAALRADLAAAVARAKRAEAGNKVLFTECDRYKHLWDRAESINDELKAALRADLAAALQEIETITNERKKIVDDLYAERDAAVAVKERAERALTGNGFEDLGGAEWRPPVNKYAAEADMRRIANNNLRKELAEKDAELKRLREAVLCLYAHCNKTERENFREEFKDVDAGLDRLLAARGGK
jgi:predicted  nucleic acid-binding Zn-ribbon protein